MNIGLALVLTGILGQAEDRFELIVPHPAQNLPHAKPALAWLSRIAPELSPERLLRLTSPLGWDPFVPTSWTKAGISDQHPWYLQGSPESGRGWIVVGVESAKQFQQTLEAAQGPILTVRPHGAVVGKVGRPQMVVAVHSAWAAATPLSTLLPVSEQRWPTYVEEQISALSSRLEQGFPRKPVEQGSGRVLPWTYESDHLPIRRAVGTMMLPSIRPILQIQATIALDRASRQEAHRAIGPTKAHWLVEPSETAAAEGATTLEPRILAAHLGLPEAAPHLSGAVHVRLEEDGALLIALERARNLPRSKASDLGVVLNRRFSGAAVRLDETRVFIGFGILLDERKTQKATTNAAAPCVIRLRPNILLSALMERSQAGFGPRPSLPEIALIRFTYGPWLAHTPTAVLSVARTDAGAHTTLEIRISDS